MKTQPLPQITGELALTSELKPPQASLSSETKRILFSLYSFIRYPHIILRLITNSKTADALGTLRRRYTRDRHPAR